MPVTDGSEKVVRVSYIHYPVWFQEGQKQIKTLLDSGSKVNAMSPAYIERLDLKAWKTNVGAQKIDSSALVTFRMVIIDIQMEDKGGKPKFF